MELEQYAVYFRDEIDYHVDFNPPDDADKFFEWRKHPDLHGWMQNLYNEKNGYDSTFNGATILLTKDDIVKLRDDILYDNLPHTTGPFFGESDSTDAGGDLLFCRKALKLIEDGCKICYFSLYLKIEILDYKE